MYDIAVIGLGPAGATLARLLSGKYRVIAVDKRKPRAGKCCGGLLSPDAQKILGSFDICLPRDVLADPQIFSVKTMDFDNRLERFYQRFYINMDRTRFENFMVSLIPENVEIRDNAACVGIQREDGGFLLDLRVNGIKTTEKSKIVIGADGADSIVRKTFFGANKIDKYMAIQEWYEDKTISPFYSCVFDRQITDSYCWTISKDNFYIIGGAFPVKNCNERFELLKEKIRKSGVSFENLSKREGCFVFLNRGLAGTCTGKNGIYLAGEAAGMISPSSLEGISYSMESAKLLAETINGGLNNIGFRYFIKTLKTRIKLIAKIFKMPFMYNRVLRKIIMKSGIKAIKKQAFPSFV